MIIAICDDNLEFLDKMRSMLRELAPDDLILSFKSGFSLLEYTSKPQNQLDLLFLDVRMPHFDGLTTAFELREIRPNLHIVVTTGYPEYALKFYEVYPLRYIVKPITPDMLVQCLDRVRQQINDDDYVLLQFKNEFQYVPVYGIYSIERVASHLHFAMKDITHTVSATGKSLDFYDKRLKDMGFFRLHRDSIVNLKHIQLVSELSVHMENGTILRVSKRKRPLLLDSLLVWRSIHV